MNWDGKLTSFYTTKDVKNNDVISGAVQFSHLFVYTRMTSHD